MSSYDAIPYPGAPIRAAHPDRLAALATLCGLDPTPVERCRVLELGCSDGGNLIALAELLPEARFHGIDNSPRQIDDGRAMITELGLGNIRLDCRDLLELSPGFEEFDFIICHGVFSWVPEPVQDRILEICGKCLAPGGVAFVSYNTLPGWRLRGMIREMMLYHVAEFEDAAARIEQSQAFLDFLVRFAPKPEAPYARLLRDELERLRKRPSTYLFHEHLEPCNTPLYFHEFMRRAAHAGLEYLGDDTLPMAWEGRAHPDAARLMAELGGDVIRREQYLDFLQGSMFRQTLLCRADAVINREPKPAAIHVYYLSANLEARPAVDDVTSSAIVEFFTPEDQSVGLGDPIVKAAVVHLGRIWPESVSYEMLLQQARDMLSGAGASPNDDDEVLADAVLRCVAAGLVHASLTPQRFVSGVSPRPRTTACARLKAARGAPVTTANHYQLAVPEIPRQILARLDGDCDISSLVAVLAEQVERGELSMEADGAALIDAAQRDAALETVVRDSLQQFARSALLIG